MAVMIECQNAICAVVKAEIHIRGHKLPRLPSWQRGQWPVPV